MKQKEELNDFLPKATGIWEKDKKKFIFKIIFTLLFLLIQVIIYYTLKTLSKAN